LLEHPDKGKSIKHLNQAFDALIAFTLVHEAHQQEVSSKAKHSSFCGPYDFLRQIEQRGPGHALLSNVTRAIRKWSDQLRYTSFEQHIAPGLATHNYTAFRAHCATLADTLTPLPSDNDYLGYFLHYFASERQSRAANGMGGGKNLRAKDAGSGGHYWENFANAPQTEEASGHPVQVVRAQVPVTPEQLSDAQDAGEDPFEDAVELAQAELVFVEDVPNSRLILNQHTSHTQQLMATINQRIWWAQSEFTLEDMTLFMRFLESSTKAQTSLADQVGQTKLLLATDDSIRGIRDRALLLVAYDTLCRRSELVSLQVKDVKIKIKNGVATSTILLRKSKTDQDSTGKWLHLSQRAHVALVEWMKELPEGREYLMVGIDRGGRISHSSLNSGQVNRIYKRIARNAGLDELVIEGISGHSMRVGAAQDLLNSGASMPIIMQRGRWSKTDTVMRYVENINFTV